MYALYPTQAPYHTPSHASPLPWPRLPMAHTYHGPRLPCPATMPPTMPPTMAPHQRYNYNSHLHSTNEYFAGHPVKKIAVQNILQSSKTKYQ